VPRQDSRLLYVRHVEGCGVDLLREVCARDLEGIVAKWKDGAYLSGDVTSWVKIKNPSYSQGIGRWERFQRKPQSRVYAARAISGLAPRDPVSECGGAGFFGDGPYVEPCDICGVKGVLIDDSVPITQAKRKPIVRERRKTLRQMRTFGGSSHYAAVLSPPWSPDADQ